MVEKQTLIRNWEKFLIEKRTYFFLQFTRPKSSRININNFAVIRTIGVGGFGRVLLARLKSSDKLYAIKVLNKAVMVKGRLVRHALSEKKVLESLDFPFVVKLDYFFHDNSYLYFVLRFVPGGELFNLLRIANRFTEDEAKFYSCQIVLCFEYLHFLGLVYRDLKPENILIDYDGYIKLTDFGFAKVLGNSRTYTLCGTPEYLSPEVILSHGYGNSVDWWTFGVFLYELCAGNTPFKSRTPRMMYTKIIGATYKTPKHFSRDLVNIVGKLLQTNVSKRIGNLKGGVEDIKRHSWYKTINWLDIINRKVKAPFQPKLLGKVDRFYDRFSLPALVIAKRPVYEKEFIEFGKLA